MCLMTGLPTMSTMAALPPARRQVPAKTAKTAKTVFAIASLRPTGAQGGADQQDTPDHLDRLDHLRCIATRLRDAMREEIIETASIDEIPPATATRYRMLCEVLESEDVPLCGLVCHLRGFIRLVEVCTSAYRGCPVTIGGALGDVYDEACAALQPLGQYPLRWSRKWLPARPLYLRLHERRAALKQQAEADDQGVSCANFDNRGRCASGATWTYGEDYLA